MIGEWARRVGVTLEMIKFQHSVFALPFALGAMLVAAGGLPSAATVGWIVAACVCARSAAMAFNRWADVAFDAANPRTAGRALVTGEVSRGFTLAFVIAFSLAFMGCAAALNRLCLMLSPVALIVLLGYSYVKRFSSLTHFVLGGALGLAPVGAWLAVRGAWEGLAPALALGVGVALWTAGFDLIYSCQDVEFDRRAGLHSIPARHGVAFALRLSSLAHALSFVTFLIFWFLALPGVATPLALVAIGLLLIYEHAIVRPDDLSRVNAAFFAVNGIISFLFLGGVILDLLVLPII